MRRSHAWCQISAAAVEWTGRETEHRLCLACYTAEQILQTVSRASRHFFLYQSTQRVFSHRSHAFQQDPRKELWVLLSVFTVRIPATLTVH